MVTPGETNWDDPYEVLGISPGASQEEVATAYHKMAQMYHPDRVAGLAPEFREIAEDRMKAINAAYAQLRKGTYRKRTTRAKATYSRVVPDKPVASPKATPKEILEKRPRYTVWKIIFWGITGVLLCAVCAGLGVLASFILQEPQSELGVTLAQDTPAETRFPTNTVLSIISPTFAPAVSPTITHPPTNTLQPTSRPLPTFTKIPTPIPPSSKMTVSGLIDSWEITVTKVTLVDKLSSPSTGRVEKARGRFAVIFMDVTNKGYSQGTFVAFGILVVRDASGNVYEENVIAGALAQETYNADIGARINPDAAAHVVAVFDISTSSASYTLSPGTLAKKSSGSILLSIR